MERSDQWPKLDPSPQDFISLRIRSLIVKIASIELIEASQVRWLEHLKSYERRTWPTRRREAFWKRAIRATKPAARWRCFVVLGCRHRRRRGTWTEVESAKDEENDRNSHATVCCARRESTPGIIRNGWRRFASCLRRICLATSLIVARTFVERRLLRGADWRAQLDRAWEDCKSRNFLAAEQQWNGRDRESAPDSRAGRQRFARDPSLIAVISPPLVAISRPLVPLDFDAI